jgi:ssDNA thymidine ADP-ribosyltransferase, DarT
MAIPKSIRLFHITAIANLPTICRMGALFAKNAIAAKGVAYSKIAYQGAQGKRAAKVVSIPPGGVVHDYVPFYFAPRSPMLLAINSGRVGGCNWRQPDIVHLETTTEMALADGAPFVFYDMNATLDFSTPYNDLARLDAVDWDLLTETPTMDGFCQYWMSKQGIPRYAMRMEKRQAEFLVQGSVSLGRIRRIGVINEAKQTEVSAILRKAGIKLQVDIMTDWYF